MLQPPVDAAVRALGLLFQLVPQGDPLEPLLGAAATIIVDIRGGNHPQKEKLRDGAARLLLITAASMLVL